MASDREQFLAQLLTAPLLVSDAIVVLCGEDADERGHVALELFKQGAAPVIVCSGGLHEPPRRVGGAALGALLMARGLAPDRILVESGSQHTADQAVNVVALAEANEWHRLIVVASSYHLPRAMLTFIRAVGDRPIRLIGVATTHLPWARTPAGMARTRAELLPLEFDKCGQHTEHVATWAEGLDYLNRWEGK